MKKLTFLTRMVQIVVLCAAFSAITAHSMAPRPTPPGYAQTRYPVVLVHGLFGAERIGPVPYFYRITDALRQSGANVYTVNVSAANSTEVRGEQLLLAVRQIMAATGAQKVNLIGHSHGAPTARYVASVRPDLVASVTSVGGANKGSPIVDIILGIAPPGTVANDVVISVTRGLAQLISLISGSGNFPQDSLAAANSLSTVGAAKFNQAHPWGVPTSSCGEGDYVVRGVAYYSWSGAQPFTNVIDPVDYLLAFTSLAFQGARNDGLISSCSSRLGRVIRDDYRMNHLDEINQTVGLVYPFDVKPTTVFLQHANRLKNAGY
jgi:triacylglycerol lipase